MRPDSWVILIEQLVSDTPEAMCTKWIDLHMLVLAGGQERTAGEYGLYRNAGLALERAVSTASRFSVIVGRPV